MENKGGAPKGNQNARKGTLWRNAIMRAVSKDDYKPLNACAEALVAKAMEGDIPALKEVGDRLDGKAHQSTSIESTELTEALVRTLAVNFRAGRQGD